MAQEARGAIARGEDPCAAKSQRKAAAVEALKALKEPARDSVEAVVAEFVERHAKQKTRDWRETEARLRRKSSAPGKGGAYRKSTAPTFIDCSTPSLTEARQWARTEPSPSCASCANGPCLAGLSTFAVRRRGTPQRGNGARPRSER